MQCCRDKRDPWGLRTVGQAQKFLYNQLRHIQKYCSIYISWEDSQVGKTGKDSIHHRRFCYHSRGSGSMEAEDWKWQESQHTLWGSVFQTWDTCLASLPYLTGELQSHFCVADPDALGTTSIQQFPSQESGMTYQPFHGANCSSLLASSWFAWAASSQASFPEYTSGRLKIVVGTEAGAPFNVNGPLKPTSPLLISLESYSCSNGKEAHL